MKSPEEIIKVLTKRWDRGDYVKDFLTPQPSGKGLFPIRIPVSPPKPAEMLNCFEQLRDEILTLRRWADDKGIFLEEREAAHQQLGKNRIPAAVTIPDIHTLATLLGKTKHLSKICRLFARLEEELPEICPWAAAHPFDLLRQEKNLDRLILICRRLRDHPRPGVYLRQVSLPGVDTKFFEKHRNLLSTWFDLLLPPDVIDTNYTGAKGFEERYGFKRKPEQVRIRFLDSGNAPIIGGVRCTDVTLTAEDFRNLELPGIHTIFVTENDINALSFPPFPGGLLIFGRGYSFSALSEAELLTKHPIYYQGDIDTHGFAILSQFRGHFPHTTSILMDRDTLLEHRDHWTEERSQTKAELPNLSDSELKLYNDLRQDRLGSQVRLEQEFIRYKRVEELVESLK